MANQAIPHPKNLPVQRHTQHLLSCIGTHPHLVNTIGNAAAPVPNGANNLAISPNPNTGTFTLTGRLPGNASSLFASIEVDDLLGRAVYANVALVNNGIMDAPVRLSNDLADGVYLVKVKNGEASQVIRFVLSH